MATWTGSILRVIWIEADIIGVKVSGSGLDKTKIKEYIEAYGRENKKGSSPYIDGDLDIMKNGYHHSIATLCDNGKITLSEPLIDAITKALDDRKADKITKYDAIETLINTADYSDDRNILLKVMDIVNK